MAKTVVGVGDPKAIKRYSAFLAVDVARESYWNRKFMGVGEDAQTPIQILPHLENDAGDQISYDLVMQLRMKPIEGDNTLRGKEEKLDFASDSLYIDQLRGGVDTGGKMTRKRTIHNMRKVARTRQSEWWGRILDENLFMYMSGARGVNDDFVYETTYAGFAGNPFKAPDTKHLIYGTGATAKANLTSSHKIDLNIFERARAKTSTLGGGSGRIPKMEPIKIEGESRHVAVIHPFQTYDLRTNSGTGQWMDIQKAASGAEGRNNPMFTGAYLQ